MVTNTTSSKSVIKFNFNIYTYTWPFYVILSYFKSL